MRRIFVLVVIAVSAPLLLAACSSGSSTPTIKVTLTEYKMVPTPGHVKAGKVKIEAVNEGSLTHEVVLMKVDNISQIPKKADGSANEDGVPEPQHAGEVDEVAGHSTKSATLDLSAGTYQMFCNVVDKGSPSISHFAKGMTAQITVG